ncbi:hypothetical protein [Pectobacterium sp. IFB5596]|uniref:hypothetical protein n=1 Tax=Pectobacterium sp. IFB5596 TaxID=1839803 RepID=UPI001F2A430F|nr:hypothetical protein [Pectobacterium sp. IFB5596]MCE9730207.1 hypothetical protein [Pectobacterium sp. IFB5596]
MILITIIITFALQQWLIAGTEGEHDIAHIASSIILASLRAGFFLPEKLPCQMLTLLSISL